MADAFDLNAAQIVNAPDVKAWPVTTAITSVIFDGATTRVVFDKQDGPNRWPDVTPPKWEGPIQYTLWLFRRLGDRWVGSAFVQFWYGREASGSLNDPDVPSRFHSNWYYDRRWSPLNGSGPIKPGEEIGFMVSSGNARDRVGPDSVKERSNIVVFPATDNGTYRFTETPPPPVEVPPTEPGVDVLAIITAVLKMELAPLAADVAELRRVQALGLTGRFLGYSVSLTPPASKKNGAVS